MNKKRREGFYVKCGDKIFAAVLKSASGSIILAILEKHYKYISDTNSHIQLDMKRLHLEAPKLRKGQINGKNVILISRNPMERFRSACVEAEKTPEEAINEFGSSKMNPHFIPTSHWLVDGCKLYKFEDHLEEAVKDLGLDWPMPIVKGKKIPKPILTPEQVKSVELFYNEDIILHRSIKKAAQPWEALKKPSVEEVLKFK